MQYLKDKGVKYIGMGWVCFIGENIIVSHNREWLIEQLGSERRYRELYSLCSTIAMGSITYGYIQYARNQGPKLWQKCSRAQLTMAFLLQTAGLIGFSQALPATRIPLDPHNQFTIRCPFDFTNHSQQIYGVQRITRHDKLWSFALLSLGGAIGSPFVGEVTMLTFPIVFALLGGWHQDYRFRRNMGGSLSAEVDAVTSAVPFAAVITGHQSPTLIIQETKPLNLLIAISLAFLLHRRRLNRLNKLNLL